MTRGRLVSVNVGRPRRFEHAGRELTSAIWKIPVAGPVAARGLNLEGDDQADREVHGGPDKAGYTYASEDLVWWGGELGRELSPGVFGENLTTEGLDVTAGAPPRGAGAFGELEGLGPGALGSARRGTPPRVFAVDAHK